MLRKLGPSLALLIFACVSILIALLILVPITVSLLIRFGYFPTGDTANWWLHVLRVLQVNAMFVACWIWIFFVGGCFASFLNVVAWRVPRNKSILGSSHCPQCEIKLTFRNNVPVLGWLRNGGKCANCQLPIPSRYLFAELTLGAIFLLLFMAETTTGGATIPLRTPNELTGIENTLLLPQADLLVTLAFHLTLVSLMFTLTIAASEKFSAPISIVIFGILATTVFQLVSPSPGIVDSRLISWLESQTGFLHLRDDYKNFCISTVTGIVASALSFLTIKFSKQRTHGAFACMLLAGIWLGWQSVLSITILCHLLGFTRVSNTSGKIMVATVVHLILWRLQSDCAWWPGPTSDFPQLAMGILYVFVLTFAIRFVNLQRDQAVVAIQNLPVGESDLE
jgi:prepilin signal peptidase PulO-like enzyme (type II secretory pathway)